MKIPQEMREKNGGYEVNRVVVSWMIALLANLCFLRKEKDLPRSFDSRRLTSHEVLTSIRNTVDNFNKQRILRRSDAKQSY